MKTTVLLLSLTFAIFAGCDEETSPPEFVVTSLAFSEGEVIPDSHTCHGGGTSPPLSFSRVPEEARGMVVILEDVDYLTGPYTHWMLWGLPAAIIVPTDIEENLPEGAIHGLADDEKTLGYAPPCPPQGQPYHNYRFTALATDKQIRLAEGSTRVELDEALKGHILGRGELTGRVPPKN